MGDDRLCLCHVLYDFKGDYEKQKTLTLKAGDLVLAERKTIDNFSQGSKNHQTWCIAKLDNLTGFVPASYLEKVSASTESKEKDSLLRDEGKTNANLEIKVDVDEMVKAVGLYSFKAEEEGQLSFEKSQTLLVQKISDSWWPAILINGSSKNDKLCGFVPCNYVRIVPNIENDTVNMQQESVLNELETNHALSFAKTIYDYSGQAEDELSFDQGSMLEILAITNEDWWPAKDADGNRGFVPSNYVRLLDRNENDLHHQGIPENTILLEDFNNTDKLGQSSYLEVIMKLSLFEHVPKNKMRMFESIFELKEYNQHDIIFTQPDDSNFFYIVVHGYVEVDYGFNKQKRRLKRNDFFGQYRIVSDENRIVTAIVLGEKNKNKSKTGCTCIRINRKSFEVFVTVCPEVKRKLADWHQIKSRNHGGPKPWINNSSEALIIASSLNCDNVFSSNLKRKVFSCESTSALKVWNEVGKRMRPCQRILQELPQYLYPPLKTTGIPSDAQVFFINVVGIHKDITEMKFKVKASTTVGEVIDMVSHLLEERTKVSLDKLQRKDLGLKLASRNSYLLQHDIALKFYKHISRELRKNEKQFTLCLVNLSRDDTTHFGHRLNAAMDTAITDQDVFAETIIECTRAAEDVPCTHETLDRTKQLSSQFVIWPYRIKLVELKGIKSLFHEKVYDRIHCRVDLVYGDKVLERKHQSLLFNKNSLQYKAIAGDLSKVLGTCFTGEWLCFNRLVSHIHLNTRVCISIYADLESGNGSLDKCDESMKPEHAPGANTSVQGMELLGSTAFQIFDHQFTMKTGKIILPLRLKAEADKSIYCSDNGPVSTANLIVDLDDFVAQIYYALPEPVLVRYHNYVDGKELTDEQDTVRKVVRAETEPAIHDTSVLGGIDTSLTGQRSRSLWSKQMNSRNRQNSIKGFDMFSAVPHHEISKASKRRRSQCIPLGVSQTTRKILMLDSIKAYKITEEEKNILWKDRNLLVGMERALPRLLFAVDWSNRQQQEDALRILEKFEPPKPLQALELLDRFFGDYRVREYAVRCLEPLEDEELSEYMLQLVQAIKYEPYHESPLARFLLRRAFQNHREIGQRFFWCLLAEMHDDRFAPRFSVLLKAYYDNCGSYKEVLSKQFDIQTLLKNIASKVVNEKFASKAERLKFCQLELDKLNQLLPQVINICLDPTIVGSHLQSKKCKVMNSKKKPLWLQFSNTDSKQCGGKPILVMFKSGDDLRQDQMTLQLLRFMDNIWLDNGLNLKLTPYQCVSSGDQVGMLELVTNANTTANIQKQYGGKLGALNKNSLKQWLDEHNPEVFQNAKAVENFVHSCAGYCVATYVLGIGDRHSDNIMLSEEGHLFHIDFGHFLGHFKSKFGLKRERTAFVFTKEMAFVMGGKGNENYDNFVQLCCRAYNCVRAHGDELINLFRLMIPAGMPELVDDDCIDYLTQKLCLSHTDEHAAEIFKKEINTCLADVYRRIDNLIHNWKVS